MENTQRYYLVSRPFPELRIPVVLAFSPDLLPLRDKINALIGTWYRNGEINTMLEESKRNYLLSRITLSEEERTWIAHNRLQINLPKTRILPRLSGGTARATTAQPLI